MISSSSFSDETLFVVCPSDHIITEIDEFHKGILVAIEEAKKGKIVTFGVKPFRSETGYGYLETESFKLREPANIKRFVEKPDKELAEKDDSDLKSIFGTLVFWYFVTKIYSRHLILIVATLLSQSDRQLKKVRWI